MKRYNNLICAQISKSQYQKIIKFDKKSKFSNISQVIDDLLKNYDTRLRPNFGCKFF